MNNKLIFNLDKENRPLKEDINITGLESSPFKEQYSKAFTAIENYLSALPKERLQNDLDNSNNIFAFIGERGSGKTSCMISVGGFISKSINLRMDFQKDYPVLTNTSFLSLELIDPSYFDEHHNILSLFLAKLYSTFKKSRAKGFDDANEDKKMRFLKALNFAQRHASLLLEDKPDYITNQVEELECLSAAVDLKRDIRDLVDAYLDYMEQPNSILLLQIDDIDLNASEAGKMAEFIRKYFIQPNILVLIALKMEQLELIKEKENIKNFRLEYNSDSENILARDMAERYLTKLFPHNQRINMPDMEDIFGKPVEVQTKNGIKEYLSIRQCVPQLIFQKTRYLFYNTPLQASYIIPRNLRELRQLIKLLWEMKDYKEKIDDSYHINKDGKYNQAVFKKYLLDIWIPLNLEENDYTFARQILLLKDNMQLNYFIVRYLHRRFDLYGSFINSLADDDNSIFNMSLGDVLGTIEFLFKKVDSIEDNKLLFYIKSVYSIRLYEAYNRVTEERKLPEIVRNNELVADDLHSVEVLSNNMFGSINEYEKLLLGSVVNVRLKPLLQYDKLLHYRSISGQALFNLMQTCANEIEDAAEGNLIRLSEFFMLSISHPEKEKMDYRKENYAMYDSPIALPVGLLDFDLGSFFFNLTRIEKCYARFKGWVKLSSGEDYIDALLKNEKTLIHDFYQKTIEKYSCGIACPYDSCKNELEDCYLGAKWLSYCSFRNVEILQDFLNKISLGKVDRNLSDRQNLAIFFKNCADYSIYTYDYADDKEVKNHKITFDFFSKIYDLLNDERIDARFTEIFGEAPTNKSDDLYQVN